MRYFLPVFFSLMGFAAIVVSLSPIPVLEELQTVAGIADRAGISSYRVHGNREKEIFLLSLEKDDRIFGCKAGEPGFALLKNKVHRGDSLQIWYGPADIFKGYFMVGQIVANGFTVVSYQEISEKRDQVRTVRLAFGAFMGIAGGFLVFLIRWLNSRPQPKKWD